MVGSTARRWRLTTDGGLVEIERAEIDALFGRMVAFRVLATPVIGVIGTGFVLIDPDPWRWALLLVAAGSLAVVGVLEYVRHRARLTGPLAIPANLLLMATFQLLIIYLSGGTYSPILPVAVPVAMVGALLLGPGVSLVGLLAIQLAAVTLFVVAPLEGWAPDPRLDPFVSGPLDPRWMGTIGVAFGLVLIAAAIVGVRVRMTFEAMVRRALSAREAERRANEEHARDLVALSGEIAHELKNPLASIKGLGALLARDLDGRSAERLAVLRGEVDRMQDILQEFLDFSRPLVPLAQAPVDLAELCAEVAELQEGIARGRGVRLTVEGAAVCRCDRRKLRQVLVNLVQNGVEAARSEVMLRVRDGDPVRIEVADDGPGLAPDVRDRVFQPGVTTKAQGSGLGLTIARSLARQQGGELELAGGAGTVATVTLPREGVALQETS